RPILERLVPDLCVRGIYLERPGSLDEQQRVAILGQITVSPVDPFGDAKPDRQHSGRTNRRQTFGELGAFAIVVNGAFPFLGTLAGLDLGLGDVSRFLQTPSFSECP